MERKKTELKIFNTMTKTLQVFTPCIPGKVGMYVCGVTVYDDSHIGHARAAVVFDVLFRYLKHSGYEVTYVRNFTDIDDKVIRQAKRLGEDPLSLSRRYCDRYLDDMDNLQCLRPTHQPLVTDHIEQIKDMITQIIKNDFAYVVEGDVFFAVDKFPCYGQLSGQKLENNRAGKRVPLDVSSKKYGPADFTLWKAAKPDEPSWESPWGLGRPGWHIECSAMSAHYLTFKFDIHGGGIDLVFPHHENEITQSAAACQESNVSYWMHHGHVTNNKEKMSKSRGNSVKIREVTERYHPLALRYFLLSAHYHSPLHYTVLQMEIASNDIFYIYQTLRDCEEALSNFKDGSMKEDVEQNNNEVGITDDAQDHILNLQKDFEKLSEDLDTSHLLIKAFIDALRFINESLRKPKKRRQLSLIQSLTEIVKEVEVVLDVLGMLPLCSYAEVSQQLKDKALKRAGVTEDDVLSSIQERAEARKNKDFLKSDRIRADLSAKGIGLNDEGKEAVWIPCIPR